MPSFPGSVKTFTTKNTGDVIQAAHINDLQDEVNAIEAGYINGTAPLNSSRSTVATLTVTGGSTLNSINVDGGSTFGSVGVVMNGPLSMFGGSTFTIRPVTPPPQAALVFLASSATLGSSALSTLAFVSQGFATNSSMHSTGASPERLTPQSTGVYQISAQVALTAGDGPRDITIVDSTGGRIASETRSSGAAAPTLNLTGYKRFDVLGSYATVQLVLSGASTLSVIPGVDQTWFSMVKL